VAGLSLGLTYLTCVGRVALDVVGIAGFNWQCWMNKWSSKSSIWVSRVSRARQRSMVSRGRIDSAAFPPHRSTTRITILYNSFITSEDTSCTSSLRKKQSGMKFSTRNAFYLRASDYRVVPLFLYLDERHVRRDHTDCLYELILRRTG
jgi:hypothetical protein